MAQRIDATVGEYLDAIEHAGAKTTREVADCLGQSVARTENGLRAMQALGILSCNDQGWYILDSVVL